MIFKFPLINTQSPADWKVFHWWEGEDIKNITCVWKSSHKLFIFMILDGSNLEKKSAKKGRVSCFDVVFVFVYWRVLTSFSDLNDVTTPRFDVTGCEIFDYLIFCCTFLCFPSRWSWKQVQRIFTWFIDVMWLWRIVKGVWAGWKLRHLKS